MRRKDQKFVEQAMEHCKGYNFCLNDGTGLTRKRCKGGRNSGNTPVVRGTETGDKKPKKTKREIFIN
jgi:hypothetical protein